MPRRTMNMPSVSVLMAVCNAERHLNEALDSILKQTFADFELIIVDDDPTDHTSVLLDSYTDPRLVRIRNDENLGLTRSLNRGLAVARGTFIARHDPDDISHPDRFRRQVACLLAHPEVGLLGTSYYSVDQDGRVLNIVRLPNSDTILRERLQRANTFCHGTVALRRHVVEQVGGYREQFAVAQDYDLWLRMAEHCKMASLPELLYQFRIHRTSISREKWAVQLAYVGLARELAIQRSTNGKEDVMPEDVLDTHPPETCELARAARESAYLLYAAGDPEEAVKHVQRAQELAAAGGIAGTDWEHWSLERAAQLAHLRNSSRTGADLITWVFDSLPLPDHAKRRGRTLGRYYATQAFAAWQHGPQQEAIALALQAVRFDYRWLWNRGLWAISARSLRLRHRYYSVPVRLD